MDVLIILLKLVSIGPCIAISPNFPPILTTIKYAPKSFMFKYIQSKTFLSIERNETKKKSVLKVKSKARL